MKKYLFLFALAIISSCTSHDSTDEALDQVDSLLQSRPERVLELIDSLEAQGTHFSKPQRMRKELIRAQAQNKAFVSFTTDSLMLELADYYEHHGTSNDRMKAYYMVGCAYRDMGDTPTALSYYRQATEQADTTDSSCDLRTLSRVYGQMGVLYNDVGAYTSENEAYLLAEHLSLEAKDTLSALIYAYTRAGEVTSLEKIKAAETLFKYEDEHNCPSNYAFFFPVKMEYADNHNDVQQLGKLLSEYEERLHITPTSTDSLIKYNVYHYFKGNYYRLTEKYDSAEYQFRRLLSRLDYFDTKEGAYQGLKNVFSAQHMADSVEKYADLYCIENDSTTLHRSSEHVLRLHSIYNYSKAQEKALKSERAAGNLRLAIVLLILGLSIIGSLAYLRYKKHMQNERNKLIQTNRDYVSLMERYDERSHELENLRADADNYQKQLAEEVQALQKQLNRYRADSPNLDGWGNYYDFKNSEQVKHLHQLAVRGEEVTFSELDALLDLTRSELPNFHTYISTHKPFLTRRETYIATLTRLQFVPSEISSLLGIKPQHLTNIKSSINKKLFNTTGAKTLEDHLLSIKENV